LSEPTKPGIEFYGGYQVYSESGVDLTLLRENLKHSVTERLESNCRNVPVLEALRLSGRRTRATLADDQRSSMLDFDTMLRQLVESKVEFVVIGGLAMVAQGSSYQTKDADFCYARTEANLAALEAALAPLHPYLRGVPAGLPIRFDVPTIRAGLNFTLTTDVGDIDLLGEVSGVGQYPQALAQSDTKEMYGYTVRVLSIDGLIAAKRAAGRVKDKLHLLELEEMKKLRDSAP
jgi:hypothetical protein